MPDGGPRQSAPFWRNKTLAQMTAEEWESLCDGCGRCCLHKLEDIDTGEVHYTGVACQLLDVATCRCSDYAGRTRRMHDCLVLTPDTVAALEWLPSTCAYRRVAEGKELPRWHPLRTGDPGSVHEAGVSVRGFAVPEDEAGNPFQHLVDLEATD